MQYKIVKNSSSYELQEEVSTYIKSGWKLQGGVSTYFSFGKEHYAQALTRE